MLLNTFTAAAPSPAALTDPPPADAIDLPAPAMTATAPLQGRALLAQLEALAQAELVRLAATGGVGCAELATPLDPALAGLAWDLGLSGAAVATTVPEAARR